MNVINNKTVLLKTAVIVKLNCIISDLKVKFKFKKKNCLKRR